MLRLCLRNSARSTNLFSRSRPLGYIGSRLLNTQPVDFESKYADKLKQRAKEDGISIEYLRTQAKKKLEEERKNIREANKRAWSVSEQGTSSETKPGSTVLSESKRKDNSPVKPLSSILNLPKILTLNASQVSALWTAYHASRSEGTGKGFLCASIPVELYEKMSAVGAKYPIFVLPLPRPQPATAGEEAEPAYEFYFMEWAFHEPPAAPQATTSDLFAKPSESPENASNIPISTILFTPLMEYKMRNSFATPYLVLTHYTDLAKTHGIVLLRGEITPTNAGNGHMLSQEDAQVLSMGLQKFYLWNEKTADGSEHAGEKMLKAFHENPDAFDWQESLKYGTQHL